MVEEAKIFSLEAHMKHCRCSSPPQQVPLVRLHHHLTLNFLHLWTLGANSPYQNVHT